MKHYETMFIVRPTLSEDEIHAKISFYEEAITKNGGEIVKRQDMGMRNLAYEIKKQKRGYYVVIYFKAPSQLVLELERLYRINEDILRFIIIKYEKAHEQKTWQTLVDRANKKPRSEDKAQATQEAPEAPEATEAPAPEIKESQDV
ncbi:MAG: 30S ribosomal protein S6 [Helicobacter sp.]|nr:30S ribosomal protein S6 [Helicobacter sp.]